MENLEISRILSQHLKGRLIQPHQGDGVRWMVNREMDTSSATGGILADEPGLGKTVMSIALCLVRDLGRPTLIVASKSLVPQWIQQIQTFSDKSVIATTYHDFVVDPARLMNSYFAVVTYGTMRKLYMAQTHAEVRIGRVMVDEAHSIKNRYTKLFRTMMQFTLRLGVSHVWALTGTPVTKSVDDVRSLLLFIGVQALDVSSREIADVAKQYTLRRTFEDLSLVCPRLRLPVCEMILHRVELSQEEKNIYNNVIQYGRFVATAAMQEGLDVDERREISNHMFEVMMRLRQITVDQSIVKNDLLDVMDFISHIAQDHHEEPHQEEEEECPICMTSLETLTACRTACGHVFCKTCLSMAWKRNVACPLCRQRIHKNSVVVLSGEEASSIPSSSLSTKMMMVSNILSQSFDDGRKSLVFAQWRKEIRTIETVVRQTVGYQHVWKLDGSVPDTARHDIISEFQGVDGPACLICQIQVGGEGLNIQAAHDVVFPSLDWSPSSELQAIARCHRIGVDHPVRVHRIVANRTIDEHVLSKQSEKLHSASLVLDDARITQKLGRPSIQDFFHIMQLVE